MINLLFISDSPRADLLRGHFQQQLKVRIAVVGDFDHGLKGVFEQRPLVVCIQDQIAGVTGESVARHIQLLLGSDAPSFILLHNANGKARPLPGLFTHLIDLTAPFEQVCADLEKALRLLLKDRWELICPVSPPVNVIALPPIHKPAAEFPAVAEQSHVSVPEEDKTAADFNDLFEKRAFSASAAGHDDQPDKAEIEQKKLPSEPQQSAQATRGSDTPQAAAVLRHDQAAGGNPPLSESNMQQLSVSTTPDLSYDETHESLQVDELLKEFEDNYRRRKRLLWKGAAVLLLLIAAGVMLWFRVQSRQSLPPPASVQSSVPPQQAQRPLSSSRQPAPQKPSAQIPSFIAHEGLDTVFSKNNPGWSRYLNAGRDYRLFHDAGQLRALQVLAVGRRPISSEELSRALQELTGSAQYKVLRHDRRQGLVVETASGEARSELLIYRNAPGGEISAFVIVQTP